MKRAVLIVVEGGGYWLLRDTPGGSRTPAAAAPPVGSCWQAAFSWSGGPVDCAGEDLLHRLDEAGGDNVKIVLSLYAQARRAFVVEGTVFLGGNWHESKVQILASWIAPAASSAARSPQVTGPAG